MPYSRGLEVMLFAFFVVNSPDARERVRKKRACHILGEYCMFMSVWKWRKPSNAVAEQISGNADRGGIAWRSKYNTLLEQERTVDESRKIVVQDKIDGWSSLFSSTLRSRERGRHQLERGCRQLDKLVELDTRGAADVSRRR